MKIIDQLTLWQYLIPQTEGNYLALIGRSVSDDFISRAIPSNIPVIKLFLNENDKNLNQLTINLLDNSVGGAVILGDLEDSFNDIFFGELFRILMPGAGICFFVSKRMKAFSFKRILNIYGFESFGVYGVFPGFSYARWVIPLRAKYFVSSTKGIFKPTQLVKQILWVLITQLTYFGFQYFIVKDSLIVARKYRKVVIKEGEGLRELLSYLLKKENIEIALLNRPQKYYQKITAQVIDENGGTIAYAKICDTPQAKALLENENKILEVLNHLEIQTGEVPKIIYFNQNEQSVILVQRAEPGFRTGPIYLSIEHILFLAEIFRKTAKYYKFEESPLFMNMKEGLKYLEGNLDEKWQNLLQVALEKICERFRDKKIQLGLTHWDFAAWNTCQNKRKQLLVFDWELATQEDLPLIDVYNFIIHTEGLIRFKQADKILSKLLNMKGVYFDLMRLYKSSLGSNIFFDPFGFLLVYLYKTSLYYLRYRNLQTLNNFDTLSGFELLEILRLILSKVL